MSELFDKAKEFLAGNEQVDQVIDQAADAAKEKTPDQLDGAVDQAAQAAKDAI
jgi:hypothetical protein